MRNRVLNIIAFTHILVPHLTQRINQICVGYSWPTNFHSIRHDLNVNYAIDYIREKSIKFLGFELTDIDYDKILIIDDSVGKMYKYADGTESYESTIRVRDLDEILNYFISTGNFLRVNDESTYVEGEEYFKDSNGNLMDILQKTFRIHGTDPNVTDKVRIYHEKYISEHKFDRITDRFIKIDKFAQRERDLKLRLLLDGS